MHLSTKWLITKIAIISLIFALLDLAGYPLLLPYGWYKLVHIFGSVVFLGNIIVTGVWMFLVEQTRERATSRFPGCLLQSAWASRSGWDVKGEGTHLMHARFYPKVGEGLNS